MDMFIQLPLADGDTGLGKLVMFIVVAVIVIGLKIVGKIREVVDEAREQVKREQQREMERRLGNRPPMPPRPTQQTGPSQTGGPARDPVTVYYPPTPGSVSPSASSSPPRPPVQANSEGFGETVFSPLEARPAPIPVPVPPKRPVPAPQRPQAAAPAPAAKEPPKAVLLLRQVEQQIGTLESNLEKLQARRRQLAALTGTVVIGSTARYRQIAAASAIASSLTMDMQDPDNLRQGIILSEVLRQPVSLRDDAMP